MPEAQSGLKILALVTDAYGGPGGIAEYNRNLFRAFRVGPNRSVEVLIRRAPEFDRPVPDGIRQRFPRGGKLGFVVKAIFLTMSDRPDMIFCGHINFLPLTPASGTKDKTV